MKLKRFLSALVAGVVTASTLATAASATTLVAKPITSSNYLINLSARCDFAKTEFKASDSYSISAYNGATITLTDGVTTQNAVLSNCKLNGSTLTKTNGNFAFSGGEDRLVYGEMSSVVWTGSAQLLDKTVDPSTIFNIANLSTTISFSITLDGVANPLTMTGFKAEVSSSSNDAIIDPSVPLTTKIFNNGLGLKLSEREDLSKATGNVLVTCELNKPVASAAVFSIKTDISEGSSIVVLAQNNETSITFAVPSTYFYNKDYGVMFNNMTISAGEYKFKSITFDYNTGSSSTSTPDVSDVTDDSNTDDEFIINVPALKLNVGASFKLTTNYSDVKWKTSSSKICKVYTSGKIKGVKAGTATITGTNSNGDTVKCKVTVINSSKPSDTFAQTSTKKATVYVGKKYTFKTTLPSSSTDAVTWVSSDTSVATVSSSGKVTAKSTGVATITAISSSGISSSRKITVKKPYITLAKSSATIGVGDTYTISATVKPTATVEFDSLDEEVATVTSKGVIKGISAGTAKIEVSANGISKIFTITVK
ncbi:MAG: Ig domain-containing protein [Ruminiclostridium sp.]